MTKILKNKYHHQTTDIKHKGIQADHQKKRNSGHKVPMQLNMEIESFLRLLVTRNYSVFPWYIIFHKKLINSTALKILK